MLRGSPQFAVESLTKSNSNQETNFYKAVMRYGQPYPMPRYADPLPINTGHMGSVANRIKPDRGNRRNVQKMTWRSSHWIKGFGSDSDDESEYRPRSVRASDVSSSVALRRVLLLYDNLQFREAAHFIVRLNYAAFKAMLHDLPVDVFIESIPSSLPILEALYGKVAVNCNDGLNLSVKQLKPESVVMHLVKLFALQNPYYAVPDGNYLLPCVQEKLDSNHPVIVSSKTLLKVILVKEPCIKKQLQARKKAIDRAIEGMGHHGLVGTSDDTLMNLHDALKLEFERVSQQYKTALQKLEDLSLAASRKQPVTSSVSHGPAPTNASHQRQLSLRQEEIQERLIKNKTLLNAAEPCSFTNQALQILLAILHQRIEQDKEVLFQFTQLRKEFNPTTSAAALSLPHGSHPIDPSSVIAPVLMRFSHGCGQVLEIFKEISREVGKSGDNDVDHEDREDESSDISGYHSDSDSTLILSSPLYIPTYRGAKKYNTVLLRSTRLKGNKPGARRVAGSCTDSASVGGKSEGQEATTGSEGQPQGNYSASDDSHRSDSSEAGCYGSNRNPVMVKGSIWTQQVKDTTELEALRRELVNTKQTVFEMKEKELKLKERLADQAQRMLERGVRFENVCLGDRRPTALIRRYGNLYAQARVDTLDALDALHQLKDADELKSKLLFSVVVLAFRSVKSTLFDTKQQVARLLQIPENIADPAAKEFETSLNVYLNSSSERFHTRKNAEEVCTQIWATLYDYPCLKNCEGLILYVTDCVRLAWALTTQRPPFAIEYETRTFRRDMHVRFHTSNQESDAIKTYLWPALLEEGTGGPCVHKGVVIT